ncbi:WD40-repeat-containing domain protein [Absidia repens]|uniref:WD40-repeat-containing domain protein n=1 Tax=Absidia repens TaxID=90262 RepID=A0A1X2IP16_9FUNG|nr:WD40-repeat-containing domain protein [Absidia repens]
MLQRSFLSASSLKTDQKEVSKASTPNRAPTKRRRPSDVEAVIEEDSASDSSSESDSDISDMYGNYSLPYLQNDIGTLQNQIQYQQSKQKKHMRKVQLLDKNIRRNTKKLGRLTRLFISQQQQPSQTSRLGSSSTNMQFLPTTTTTTKKGIKAKDRLAADERDAPLFQLSPSSSTLHHPKTKTTITTPPSEAKPLLSIDRPRSTKSHAPPSPPPPSGLLGDKNLAYQDTLDVLMRKKVTTMKDGFDRKARTLLCNNNENVTDEHMKDLMVSSSLDGELQFWNACDKKRIDKLGGGAIFKDTWIEDLCWASPTVLTLAPASREGVVNTQSVVVLDLKSVDRNSVRGDIQTMTKIPHEKGFDVITAADFGNRGSALKEKISFVTAGGDKSVYLWNLSRDDRNDSFDEELHRLDIRHTNRVQALCIDKHSNTLYSGGADNKLDAFDMERGTSIYEFHIGNRINSINLSNANPNYALIGLSKNDHQFCLYDKRCYGVKGVRLRFGATESENMSKYAQPDWHSNGHTVVYGSQGGPRLNFWDIRYTDVGKGPSFTIALDSGIAGNKSNKVVQSVFLPNRNTMATVTASRTLIWMDYSLSENCKPSPINNI